MANIEDENFSDHENDLSDEEEDQALSNLTMMTMTKVMMRTILLMTMTTATRNFQTWRNYINMLTST